MFVGSRSVAVSKNTDQIKKFTTDAGRAAFGMCAKSAERQGKKATVKATQKLTKKNCLHLPESFGKLVSDLKQNKKLKEDSRCCSE